MLWSVPADRVHSRRELYSSSRQCGTKPPADGIPSEALVSFCGKGQQPQRALQLLEPMRYQGLLPDGLPYGALDSTCGNGPTAMAWATSVCCREGQLGGRWPSGRASNVAIRWDPLPRFGQCLRKWANSHRMGYLCVLPGGQLGGRWPSGRAPMRYRGLLPDGIPYRVLTVPADMGQQPLHGLPLLVAGRGSLEVVGHPGGHQCGTKASCQMGSPTALLTVPAEMGQQPLHGLPLWLPGGATWRSLAIREGIQRGQSVRARRQSISQSGNPGNQYATYGRQLG